METSRRTFIKGLGITAAYALGALPPGSIGAQEIKPEIHGASTITYTTCEMCSYRCPIKAQVSNGKVFLEGNSNSSKQRTRICGRGGSGYSLLNDPKRIVEPMRRAGKRGEGEWDVISWETAYKEIAEKMNAIAKKYGAESVAFSSKSGSLHKHLFEFARAFGSPNTFTHLSTCPGGRYVTTDIIMGFNMGMDVKNTKYLIHFGHNLFEGVEVANTNAFMAMQAKGGKVVSFDPRLSIASSKADEYYMIKPGCDTAVILALCNVIIQEKLYDKNFVNRYVNGFEEYAEAIKHITPEYAEKFSDVPAADIKRIAREFMAAKPHCIASLGHRTTFSYEEFDMRRGLIALNMMAGNADRKGGLTFSKNVKQYNSIAGKEAIPKLKSIPISDAPKPGMKRIDEADPTFKHAAKKGGIYQSIFTSAVSGKPYPIKGWVMTRTNPLQTAADRPTMLKAIDNMDLVVCCDVYLTDTSSYADYFLPECTYLERTEDIIQGSGTAPSFAIRQQAVDIIGNAKPSWQIWRELADAVGVGEYYGWKTMQERHLAQCSGHDGFYEELCSKGSLSFGPPLLYREPDAVKAFVEAYPESARHLDDEGLFSEFVVFNTASGKVELCPKEFEEIAPAYQYPRFQNIPLKNKDEEYYFIQGKVALHTNGATAFVPVLSYYMPDNPIWIHPKAAAKFGLKNGDYIELENSVGKERGKVMVTEGIHPEVVFTYMAGSGVKKGNLSTAAAKNGANCANLIKMSVCDITGTVVHTAGVNIKKV